MPITVTSTSGSVVHMRPLPSDSTTQTVPVSAMPKFAPLTAMGADRNFSRRCRRAASARAAGSSESVRPAAIVASKSRADLRAVAVDRRDQDVRRPVARELVDELGQVGLDRGDPLGGQAVVEADLVGGDRLDLDDLRDPVLARDAGHDRVGLGRVARPVDDPAGADDGLLQPLQQLGEGGHRARLDRRARRAQLLPVLHLPHGGGPRARMVPVARARLTRSCPSPEGRAGRGGESLRAHSRAARISARCIVRTPVPLAAQRAADVHEAGGVRRGADLGAGRQHVADLVGEHRHRGVGVLQGEGAAEPAALLAPRADRPGRCRAPPRAAAAAGRPRRARAASGRWGGRSRGAGTTRPRPRRRGRPRAARSARAGAIPAPPAPPASDSSPASAARRGASSRSHAGTRGRRTHDELLAGEDPGGAPRQVERLVAVAGVAVHLAAAGLLLGERHLASEALQQLHDGPPHPGEERVVEAGDEQGDADRWRGRPHPYRA